MPDKNYYHVNPPHLDDQIISNEDEGGTSKQNEDYSEDSMVLGSMDDFTRIFGNFN